MYKGINCFLEFCKKEGVPSEWFCVSEARTHTIFDKVYTYQARDKWTPDYKYAIKYFPQDDLFICWNAQIKKRKNYRLMKEEVLYRLEQNQLIAKKGIEFAWRDKEDVYVFKTENINQFVKFIKILA